MSLLQDVLKANSEDVEGLSNGRIQRMRRSSSEENPDSDSDELVNVVRSRCDVSVIRLIRRILGLIANISISF